MIPGVGPRLLGALLERFGSAEAVLAAPAGHLRAVSGVGHQLAERIASSHQSVDVGAELARCQRHGIEILTPDHSQYPRLLREIPDPPAVLFVEGTLRPEDRVAIAIVGTRHASEYGKRQAARLAAGLARAGLTVVSGLARGIDTAAHQGALDAGGRTLAVLASGLLNIEPEDRRQMARQLLPQGALLSENPTRCPPLRGGFPRRNRLLSGMSLGVLVVEAPLRSGALITAHHAAEQGRDVFAVPGRVDSRSSRGCHRLLREGAKLVESAEDVLDELGPLVEATPGRDGRIVRHPAEYQLNDQEQAVLDCIDVEPTSIDGIAAASGLPVHRVLSTISVLEMRRLVRRISGHQVARA
jgi:DNA processing protein